MEEQMTVLSKNDLLARWRKLVLSDPACHMAATMCRDLGLAESDAWLMIAVFRTEAQNEVFHSKLKDAREEKP